jgi:hypothetical protein
VLLGVSSIAKLGTWCAAGRHTDNSFAIWNVVSGGEAIEHFDGTDKGWLKTLRRFESLHRGNAGSILGVIGAVAVADAISDA